MIGDSRTDTCVGQFLDGKYQVLRLLGQGGMGAVYEGVHTGIGRPVAIKFLHADLASNVDVLKRFQQEARIAGGIGHPNICEVTDIGYTAAGVPFMVMPYLVGRTLADVMSMEAIPIERALDLMDQILSALEAAHNAGIIHRDLKPENIFVIRAGVRRDLVKILDFGISKVVSEDPSKRGLTSTGMVMGTPYYMAPEQARGTKNVDARVDIYSTGVILYELLTGRKPFDAETFNELIIKIATEPFISPRELRADIPHLLEQHVIRAMARTPSERFESAAAFREALFCFCQVASAAPFPLALSHQLDSPATGQSSQQGAGADRLGECDPSPADMRSGTSDDIYLSQPTAMAAAAIGKGLRHRALLGGAIVLLCVVALALLLTTPWRNDQSKTSQSGSNSTDAQAPATAMEAQPSSLVSITFVGLPPGGQILLDGRSVTDGKASVARGSAPITFRATAPGHDPHLGTVEPLHNQVLRLQLRAISTVTPSARSAMTWSRPSLKISPVRRVSYAGKIRPVAVRARLPSRPALPARSIMGRRGTDIDTSYDED